jgi:pyruvate-formate lyase-activating enzyme
MSPQAAQPTAALAGVPNGIQSQGILTGRRQVFIRFASEAETAQMYTAAALVRELARLTSKAVFHSICVAGRDVLGNADFLLAVFQQTTTELPIVLDTDGQRPESLAAFHGVQRLTVVQVHTTLAEGDAAMERSMKTIAAASEMGVRHSLVIGPKVETSDQIILRAIEQAHRASPKVEIVVHPLASLEKPGSVDRRWATLLEQASATHPDVRLLLRVPPPAGLR